MNESQKNRQTPENQPVKDESEHKPKISTFYLVACALFTALSFAATFFVNIQASVILGAGGNINLGDAVLFIAAAVLGPFGGAVVGALGPAAADLAGGYIIYAPFTLFIKGAAGFFCGLIYKNLLKKSKTPVRRIVSMAVSSAVIVAGYFFAEMIILLATLDTPGGFTVILIDSLRTIVPNLLQVAASMAIAYIVLPRIPELFDSSGAYTG